LESWRPAVLSEMGRRQLWRGAGAAECEDQFQDVALILWSRQFASEEHLRRALWTGLGFRARDFWKSARRREVPVGEFFEDVVGDDRTERVEDAAVLAADKRCVDDCLSELDPRERAVYRLIKGDELSRCRVAKRLGLGESDVLRALYSAQRKIDQVVVLFVAGRLCGRRRPAVISLARAEAQGSALAQARAHLAHCPDCLLAFREQRAALGRRVASVLPVPAVAASTRGPERIVALVDHVRSAPAAAKRQLYELAGRRGPGAGPEEALAGAGGAALGTKVVVGLCVGAAAGGGALCVGQLGIFPARSAHHSALAANRRHPQHTRARAKAAIAQAPAPAAQPQPTPAPPGASTPTTPSPAPASTSPPHPQSPPPEFFGGSTGGASSAAAQGPSSSSAPPTRQPAPAAAGSSRGGGEFFGG
jgi:RNA polymerase sigma factor (sigma-70 family)